MNIEKLYVGQTFKNYKMLCEELGMEAKKANSKKAQLKELDRFCRYHNVGQTFYIDEIYETPKEKVENRGKSEGSRRNIYGNAVQLLITDLLAKSDGYITISKNKLMLSIGMININYGYCGQQVKKLAKHININEKVIYDFYNTNNSNFTGIIETALNNLEDKAVIRHNKIIKVCDQGKYTTRVATKLEELQIMEYEKETLEELGFDSKSKVRVSKKWTEFKKETQKKLNKNTTIQYYYSAYEIIINKKYIEEERNKLADLLLEQVVKNETVSNLNSTIIENITKNAENRQNDISKQGKMSRVRNSFTYIEDIKKLATILVDKSTRNITNEIKNIKLEEELPPDIIEQCELLFG